MHSGYHLTLWNNRGFSQMNKSQINVVFTIAVVLSIALVGLACADTGVPAVPEIQGLSTGTSSNVIGTVTETDSGAWTLTNDPFTLYTYTERIGGVETDGVINGAALAQLQAAGGSVIKGLPVQYNVPQSLLNTQVPGYPPGWTWLYLLTHGPFSGPTITSSGIHNGVLDPGQVQYTAGYNAQYSGVSGQQTFAKSMALSTANQIADQSNLEADTNVQFIAVDTGRATNSEDLLLDGASQAQNSSGLILCPFANANPGIIPAFCNIVQAGSAFDTTRTSTVTSADTRFVGTDATIPTVLDYTINAQGITLGDGTSSPMIGSVSAYLKVHVQESRNESTISGTAGIVSPAAFGQGREYYSFPNAVDPAKSEDLVYSETSTASGLISGFAKSMSYSSQASAVLQPQTVLPALD